MPLSTKRKPIDMPEPSPPLKRVTRSRAAKAEENENSKQKTTRITTASAKASVKKQPPAPPARAKCKTKADDKIVKPTEVEMIDAPEIEQAPKTRDKTTVPSKKTVPQDRERHAATTTRSRQNRANAAEEKKPIASRTTNRSKKSANDKTTSKTSSDEKLEDQVSEPPARATRGRTTSTNTKPAATRAKTPAPALKKKVAFESNAAEDKENRPVQSRRSQKAVTSKEKGLKAKPIRKPAASRGSTRGKNVVKDDSEAKEVCHREETLPLSPKKVTQVAKAPSSGSEDELSGDKTPLRSFSISPKKSAMSVNRDPDFAFKPNSDAQSVPSSPTREPSPSRLAASPRKPPPSPFKDAMKESPRKIDLGLGPPQLRFDVPQSPSKKSTLNMSSPKRINIGTLVGQPNLPYSKTPMKNSLLQSPARRLGASSTKTPAHRSPGKPDHLHFDFNDTKDLQSLDISEPLSFPPRKPVSSPLRAKTPTHSPKMHHKTPKMQSFEQKQDWLRSPSPRKKVVDNATSPQKSSLKSPMSEGKENPDLGSPDLLSISQLAYSLSKHKHQPRLENILEKNAEVQTLDQDISEIKESPIRSNISVQQMNPPAVPAFRFVSHIFRDGLEESDSEDELSSPQKACSATPLRPFGIPTKSSNTPRDGGAMYTPATLFSPSAKNGSAKLEANTKRKRDNIPMTPLALQMSSWRASSPEKKQAQTDDSRKRGIFSPAGQTLFENLEGSMIAESPVKSSFFEDEMTFRDAADEISVRHDDEPMNEILNDQDNPRDEPQASQNSQASEEYGDENAEPLVDPAMFAVAEQQEEVQNLTMTCTPAKVFCNQQQSREIHTVSKVPLRPAGEEASPVRIPRKRSRSLAAAGPLSVISSPERLGSISRDSVLSPLLQNPNISMSELPGEVSALDDDAPRTPLVGCSGGGVGMISASNTPGRTVRKTGVSDVLKGAVVYVDVHTTEGADASGIFVDLLTQMGARCIKQWHWNPRASFVTACSNNENLANPNQQREASLDSPSSSIQGGNKIGITHVVFKDGGKRTLEKVRDSKGVVLCVGVGWVLE